MKKIMLIIVGILLLVMGIMGLVPGLALGTEPVWHAIVKIVIGAIALLIALKKDKQAS